MNRVTSSNFSSVVWRLVRASLALPVALATTIAVPCSASEAQAKPAGHSGVTFTKVQDLSTTKRAENRPVKNKWAVVIGIDKFVEKPLNNGLKMDKAAQDFYDYLVDPKAGRFEKDHVRILTNQNASRQGILNALGDKWLGQVAGPDDLIVVFIGTHGFPAADGNTYLCAQNTVLDNVYTTGISMNDLMQNMKSQIKSDRIVIVLQACYSGAAQLASGAKALFHFYNVDLGKFVLGKGYVILSSSQPNQVTWGDIFSQNLIKGLREHDGLVTLNDAFKFAQAQTQHDTTHDCQGCKEQTPVMKADWTGNDLVLGAPPAEHTAGVPASVANYLTAESSYAQGNVCMQSGDLDGAIVAYQAAISTDPKYADAQNDYATAVALKGNWDEAATAYEKAVSLKPDDALYHANYARALVKTGKTQEAQKELLRAYELNPKDKNVLSALADVRLKQNDLAGASLYLKEALQLYPSSANLHNRLSYVLAQESQQPGDDWVLELALQHANAAVKDDEKSVPALLNLGSVQLLKGQSTEAVATYQNAAKLAPDNADVYYLLSSALEKDGKRQEAAQALQKFLDICPSKDLRAGAARVKLSSLGGK